ERSVTQSTRDISIVIAAASTAATTPSAVTSFVNLKAAGTAAGTATAADVVTNSVATAGTTAGYLFVGNRNAADGSATAADSITATVTGAGQVCTTTGFASPTVVTCGKNIKVSAIGDVQFAVQADGSSGTGTFVVSSSVAGWSFSKTATFYAAAAKTLTATVAHPSLKIGTNSGAVRVTGLDANGTAWMGTAYIVASAAQSNFTGDLVGGVSTATLPWCINGYASNNGSGIYGYTFAGNTTPYASIQGENAGSSSSGAAVRGTSSNTSAVGVNGALPTAGAGWGGLFQNDLGYTGSFLSASDQKIKKNIQTINKPLDIIKGLRGVTYEHKLDEYAGLGLKEGTTYGFIAQEVEQVMPEIVKTKNIPYYSTRLNPSTKGH
ncbi:MAG: tail fiber domain-containing protein, partial [Actinobacteria bacterium]|nr:tail fiber domain-containing protein [Actinomycetota bacterium]